MKKVLSIDGGGIRGLIPALVLAEIEQRTGKPIAALFDLIAGTSTGGILALGLTRENGAGAPQFSAARLAQLYETRGREIFARSFWRGMVSLGGAAEERYSATGLESVLSEYFGDEPLGSSLKDTLVPAYDIQNREPLFFKSWKEDHKSVLSRHVARATSAAPTYFEPALVPIGGSMKALVDGGVFINSPAVSAFVEAKKRYPEETEFLVVSLGTGELVRPISHQEAKSWGAVEWLAPLLSCMFDGVADAANYQLRQLLGSNYVRLQTNLSIASDDMDNASQGNLENLKSEARKLLQTHRQDVNALVTMLSPSS